MSKLKEKKPTKITTWETQVTKLTTSKKVNVDFFLPEFSETKIVSWKFHLDNQNNSRYDMILVRYLIHALGLDIKFSENIIFGGDVPYQGCSAPMVDLNNYKVKSLTEKIVKPEKSFINLYVNECLESESTISSTSRMRIILDTK